MNMFKYLKENPSKIRREKNQTLEMKIYNIYI